MAKEKEICKITFPYPMSEDTLKLNEKVLKSMDLTPTAFEAKPESILAKPRLKTMDPSSSPISELDFSRTIEDLLTRFGWRWVHSRPAMTKEGWVTPLSGVPGFPDYLAVRERIVVIELKSDTGQLEAEQYFWLSELSEAGIEAYLWQPRDNFEEIVNILK